jgi:peptidyl-dipeptidase A
MALAVQHALHLTSIMKRHTSSVLLLLIASISPAFAETKSPIQERADRFLALANTGYQAVYRVNSEAQWNAVTDVTPEHDAAAEATGKAYAAFNGNAAIINESRELLTHQKELNEITVRQLKQLLLNAAEGPMTNPELVVRRVTAETKTGVVDERLRIQI